MVKFARLFGWDLVVRLLAYGGLVLVALGVQMIVVFSVLLVMLAKKSPLLFFRQVQEAMVMAFATASSNATLPTALRVADKELKLPPKVARFVLTIGATANPKGTALFEGVTVRSEERRGGQEGVSRVKIRSAAYRRKKNTTRKK